MHLFEKLCRLDGGLDELISCNTLVPGTTGGTVEHEDIQQTLDMPKPPGPGRGYCPGSNYSAHRGKSFVFFVRKPTCRAEASETKEVRISRAGTRVRYVDFQKDELVSISGSCCGTGIVGSVNYSRTRDCNLLGSLICHVMKASQARSGKTKQRSP